MLHGHVGRSERGKYGRSSPSTPSATIICCDATSNMRGFGSPYMVARRVGVGR